MTNIDVKIEDKDGSKCFYFDGKTSRIWFDTDPIFNFGTRNFAVELEMYHLPTSGSSAYRDCICRLNTDNSTFSGCVLGFNPSTVRLSVAEKTGAWKYDNWNVNIGEYHNAWHTICYQRNGTNIEIWLDETKKFEYAVGTLPLFSGTNCCTIGADDKDPVKLDGSFYGWMKRLTIYNTKIH